MAKKFNLLHYSTKRPNNSYPLLKSELIEYLRQEVKKNHYPTRRELEQNFSLRLSELFYGIKDLYARAGIEYVQKNSQELKQKKADMLTRVVLNILPKWNLDVLEVTDVHKQGIDIVAQDMQNKLIGIELKAYNKYESVKKRNIQQLNRFLKQGFSKIILITTTSKVQPKIEIPPEIQIITFNDLSKFVNKKQQSILEFIRNKSVHFETEEKTRKRQKILQYTEQKLKLGQDVSYVNILKDLHLDLYTYFDNISELFITVKSDLPLKILLQHGRIGRRNSNTNMALRQIAINKILKYISQEIRKDHYPTAENIEKYFDISYIWNLVTMKELYHEQGYPAYLERKTRK